MAQRSDGSDPYPYQIDEKARDENMARLILPARKRVTTMKEQNSPILNTVNDSKDSRQQVAAEIAIIWIFCLSLLAQILQKLPRFDGKRKLPL